ncbi:O-antigen polymerase [Thalassotalea aquiviva]|uniref:O-antigen polymerase n=1 Tax=Thalassotalea aquiviva TaxID=3242415 RepID=UPI00352B35BD
MLNPLIVIFIPYTLGLVLFFLPNSLLNFWVGEDNLALFNIEYLFILTMFFISYYLGCKSYSLLLKKNGKNGKNGNHRRGSKKNLTILFNAIIISLLLFVLIDIFTIVNSFSITTILSSRDLFIEESRAPSLLFLCHPFIVYLYLNQSVEIKKSKVIFISPWFYISIYIVISFLLMQRTNLFFLVLNIAIIYFWKNSRAVELRLFVKYAFLAVFALAVFNLISDLRDDGYTEENKLIGYTLGSYNRFAAVIDTSLKYESSGTGYYSLRALLYPPIIKNSEPFKSLRDYLNFPDDLTKQWQSQFQSVKKINLNPKFVWVTSFGAFWIDLGPFAFLVFFVLGFILQSLYIKTVFRNDSNFQIFTYSALVSAVILGFGPNFITFPGIMYTYYFIITWFFLRRVKIK